MKWLIIEDALRDRKGHWFEYLRVFRQGLECLGDQVRILADRDGDPDVLNGVGAEPLLPKSIWHRMGDGAGPLKRLLRIPLHALATWRALAPVVREASVDVIFVPTVLPHHLLAWTIMIKTGRIATKTKLLLYFLSTPIKVDPTTGMTAFYGGPTALLLRLLLQSLLNDVRGSRVVLAAETEAMCKALCEASGVAFTYLPQPVEASKTLSVRTDEGGGFPLMACYGAARHEKGSDVLQAAIANYLRDNSETQVRFAIQWIDDFRDEAGNWVRPDPELLKDPRVTFIRRYFEGRAYEDWLKKTDVMLLPYRRSTYGLRGSRVALEAMVDGLPVIVTKDTAPGDHVARFGVALHCDDGSVDDLTRTIAAADANLPELKERAEQRRENAMEHFSVGMFRKLLLESIKSEQEEPS